MPRPAIVFDVNETLLDLSALDGPFADRLGSADARRDWFKQLLALSLIANVLDEYTDFTTLGRRALEMIAAQRGVTLDDEARGAIATAIAHLPPHEDVRPSLARLRDAGFRLGALTNSAPLTVRAQLANAGIADFFDVVCSVDAVRRFKPAPQTYHHAAAQLGVRIEEIVLVAAHGWDVHGAMRAGARAAFVARPGQVLVPDVPLPEIAAPVLGDVVTQLIERGPRS